MMSVLYLAAMSACLALFDFYETEVMTVSLTTRRWICFAEQEPDVERDGADPASSTEPDLGFNYIPGGFPRNGLPSGSATFLLSLTLLLSSLFLAICVASFVGTPLLSFTMTEGIALLWTVWLIFYLHRICRTSRGVTPVLVVISLLAGGAFGSAIPAAILVCFLFILSAGSLLLITASKKSSAWIPLIPIGATALAWLACINTPVLSLAALLPWPTVLVLSAATSISAKKRTIGRVGLICLTSLTLGATALLVGAWLIWDHNNGALSIDILKQEFEAFRTTLIQQLLSIKIDTGSEVLALFADEAKATDYVNLFLNVLPGVSVIVINVLSFMTLNMLTPALRSFGFGSYISREMLVFRMTPYAAVVFLLSFFITLFTGDAPSLAGTVAQNVLLILEPGLALCGLGALMARLVRRRKGGLLLFGLFAVAAFFMTAILILILAVYGAGSILFFTIAQGLRHRDPPDAGSSPRSNDR
jgi:hypothetical protein